MSASRVDEFGDVTTLRPIDGYEFELSCPECGENVTHIASGTSSGRECRAVAKCVSCLRSWVVIVQLGVAGRMSR